MRKSVTHQTRNCPHLFHLVMTLITCGIWFPIWFIDALIKASVKEKVTTYHYDS